MGGTTPVLNTVRICWRRHSGVYRADCRCGATSEHPKLTAAEKWATAHRCKETTMRPPGVADTLGVWDAQGPFRLDVNDATQLVAWVKTLEQRNAAARMHIARARVEGLATAAGYDATVTLDAELAAALDILRGEVTA